MGLQRLKADRIQVNHLSCCLTTRCRFWLTHLSGVGSCTQEWGIAMFQSPSQAMWSVEGSNPADGRWVDGMNPTQEQKFFFVQSVADNSESTSPRTTPFRK